MSHMHVLSKWNTMANLKITAEAKLIVREQTVAIILIPALISTAALIHLNFIKLNWNSSHN